MTFGILRANAYSANKKGELTKGFVLYTPYFCEHRTNTVGFVFEEKELADFVEEHGADPLSAGEVETPKNWADDFADCIGQGLVRIFWAEHESSEGIIPENYDRFEVYARQ